MNLFDLSSPIVATGRGGSGTRMLSMLLQNMGIFLGNELNISQDSVEWADLLYSVAQKVVPKRPETFGDDWSQALQDNAQHKVLNATHADVGFWGWKLPESMLCIPEIHAAFPRLKLIHLVRHPVTSSLRRSHVTSRSDNPVGMTVLKAAYKSLGWDNDLIKVNDIYLNNAATWLFQVESMHEYAQKFLNSDSYLVIRYEDLCNSPKSTCERVSSFLGIDATIEMNLGIDMKRISQIDSNDQRVGEIWSMCEAVGKQFEYKCE